MVGNKIPSKKNPIPLPEKSNPLQDLTDFKIWSGHQGAQNGPQSLERSLL